MALKISIVTPNRNSGHLIGETIDNVIGQGGVDLDYIVIDGASTDDSRAVIANKLPAGARLVSEPDEGLYDALNKGFGLAHGDIMGWLNAGDLLLPNALLVVADIFQAFPAVEWLTSRILTLLDERGRIVLQTLHYGFERQGFLRGDTLPGFGRGPVATYIQQESTFWRRSLWERAGGRFDPRLRVAGDFDLWARFFQRADLWSVSAPLGAFRKHEGQLSVIHADAYAREASDVLRSHGGRPRSAAGAAARMFLRRTTPRALRPVAHQLRLFRPAPIIDYDFETHTWNLTRL
jgi:glycosyltransferase involved in cell wall biosynthesis